MPNSFQFEPWKFLNLSEILDLVIINPTYKARAPPPPESVFLNPSEILDPVIINPTYNARAPPPPESAFLNPSEILDPVIIINPTYNARAPPKVPRAGGMWVAAEAVARPRAHTPWIRSLYGGLCATPMYIVA